MLAATRKKRLLTSAGRSGEVIVFKAGDQRTLPSAPNVRYVPGVNAYDDKPDTVFASEVGSNSASASNRMNCLSASVSFRSRSRSEERRVGKECRSRWSPNH